MKSRCRERLCRASALSLLALGALASCANRPAAEDPVRLRYVGSSTVANFLRDAESVRRSVAFEIDTRSESSGGEQAILSGAADLAGVARPPSHTVLAAGVVSTLIGRDAIAVIVNRRNRVARLSLSETAALFRGEVRSWAELGGPDLPVVCLVPHPASATHSVFRAAVLGDEPYGACREVAPDEAISAAVAETPGAIGMLSFSFLAGADGVRAIVLDGEEPSVSNFDYPIARPLQLLWREGAPEVEEFVHWATSSEGQQVLMRRFVGVRVLGGVGPAAESTTTGTLVVYTETFPVYDGGIYYYPHRPYQILTRGGQPVRRVANHLSDNDERPSRVTLTPGTYLIRASSGTGSTPEFFVTIRPGEITEVDVAELIRDADRYR